MSAYPDAWSYCFWDSYDHFDIEDGASGKQITERIGGDGYGLDTPCLAIKKADGGGQDAANYFVWDLDAEAELLRVQFLWSYGLAAIRELSIRCDWCVPNPKLPPLYSLLVVESTGKESSNLCWNCIERRVLDGFSNFRLRAVVFPPSREDSAPGCVRLCEQYIGANQGRRIRKTIRAQPEQQERVDSIPPPPTFLADVKKKELPAVMMAAEVNKRKDRPAVMVAADDEVHNVVEEKKTERDAVEVKEQKPKEKGNDDVVSRNARRSRFEQKQQRRERRRNKNKTKTGRLSTLLATFEVDSAESARRYGVQYLHLYPSSSYPDPQLYKRELRMGINDNRLRAETRGRS
jgi:hypothetical protein